MVQIEHINIRPILDGKVTTMGYVTFKTVKGAQNAINNMTEKEFNGSPLRVISLGTQGSGYHVNVYNIPEGTGEETIKSYFSSVGEVLRVKILPCRDGMLVLYV